MLSTYLVSDLAGALGLTFDDLSHDVVFERTKNIHMKLRQGGVLRFTLVCILYLCEFLNKFEINVSINDVFILNLRCPNAMYVQILFVFKQFYT